MRRKKRKVNHFDATCPNCLYYWGEDEEEEVQQLEGHCAYCVQLSWPNRVCHPFDGASQLNLVTSQVRYVSDYREIPIKSGLFSKGKNVMAVHCHQTSEGQYIDVGVVDVIEKKPK